MVSKGNQEVRTMKAGEINIEEIKARLSIPEAWRLLNLPGEPGKSCMSPFREDRHPSFSVFAEGRRFFREDRHPSFSVFAEGRRFRDHASGDSGTVIDFIQLALDVPLPEALSWAREKCGGAVLPVSFHERKSAVNPAASDSGNTTGIRRNISAQSLQTPGYTVWGDIQPQGSNGQGATKTKPSPKLRPARAGELKRLAEMRGYSLDTLAAAQTGGLLRFADVWRRVAWCVCDPCGRIAEGRRLDGLPWDAYGAMPTRKCHAWGGGKSWPVNLEEAARFPKLAFVEGGPDVLAALEIVRREGAADAVGVVGMLGAANTRLDAEALP
ncbi:MAG: hypothetical protein NTV80_04505, partial [Verrucomicrobia bacterium]|nr:hypothetical protein [Verrucomicrobiota bacterium]